MRWINKIADELRGGERLEDMVTIDGIEGSWLWLEF
jgi:hypothetical protein